MEFVVGQRWVSNTESELGLGIVVENTGRLIGLSFPAANESRTYAIDNAPISRVEYSVGDQISSADGVSLSVTERHEKEGILIYFGIDQDGNGIHLDELDLDSFVQFSKPQDRLFTGQVDKNSSFELRVETLALMRKHQQSPAFGLLGPRVQLLAHQFYIASQVTQRHAPRVLLADEVGLGKTIEAGLILHHQIITGSATRVLIVVPDSLLHQWLVEMLRRFNLYFTILDEQRCQAESEIHLNAEEDYEETTQLSDSNPFESSQLVLCSLSFLVDNPERHAQALDASWDMMVVDEAHHLEWSEGKVSPAYHCIERLAREIPSLLLLTATPEQLGIESHFARLRLLDPDRYYDLGKFQNESSRYQQINELIEHLQADNMQELLNQQTLIEQLDTYLGKGTAAMILADDDLKSAIEQAIVSLLDRHGTGRVLFRNTRDVVKGFPERKLNHYSLEKPKLEIEKDAPIESLLHPEEMLADQWWLLDTRVEWMVDFLSQHRDQKVLVIAAKATTALELEEYLRTKFGLRSAVFHEGLSLIARDRAAAYFGEEEDGAQILICSEIGSEGRNFQFAHHLVLFDLPLNPDLLEQRIGRLDRIGQAEVIQIHVPYHQDSAQAALVRWYHEGLNAFERVCPVSVNVYQQLAERLKSCLRNNSADDLETLISEASELTESLLEKLQLGRDRLLELSSCHPQKASEVLESVNSSTSSLELEGYMEKVFDHFGVDQQAHSQHVVILHPGDHMICHTFPGLTEDGITATYRRSQAMIREDMQFLSWEHPIVSGATDMILNGDFGNTAFCTLKNPALKPGTLILEAIYIVHCAAPKRLQLQKYLPLTTIRVVVDSLNRDLSDALSFKVLNQMAERVPLHTVQELIKHARPQVNALIKTAEKCAGLQRENILGLALEQMQQVQNAELERLRALAEVNPNIRRDEIEFMQASSEQLQHFLQTATLKLDAIRVALAT